MSASPTTPAGIGIARSARGRRHGTGCRRASRTSCRSSTSTWSSPCRRRSPTSPCRTRRRSTASCSRPRPRPSGPSPPTRSTSAPRSASLRAAHLGPDAAATTRTSTVVVPGGGPLAGRHPLDRLPPGVLPAGQGAVAAVPAAGSRSDLVRAPSPTGAALLRRSRAARRPARLRRPSARRCARRLGRLRQTALRRPGGGAGLPRPLHPPRRDLRTTAWSAQTTASLLSGGRTAASSAGIRCPAVVCKQTTRGG